MNLESIKTSFKNKFSKFNIGFGASSFIIFKDELIFVIDNEKHWQLSDEALITFGCVGGSIEEGETFEEALHREVKEEINCEIQLFDNHETLYFDLQKNISKLSLKIKRPPWLIYEHKFNSQSLGETYYLICVYNAYTQDVPNPSSEIPALFSLKFNDLQSFQDPMSL